jgi:hypothetical protein
MASLESAGNLAAYARLLAVSGARFSGAGLRCLARRNSICLWIWHKAGGQDACWQRLRTVPDREQAAAMTSNGGRQSAQELPDAHLLATLATLGKVPPIRDKLEQAFVKQSMKPRLDHSLNHFVNWPLADLIVIVRIPLSPPV